MIDVGILSTYPPSLCGIATFAGSLADGLLGAGVGVQIVRLLDAGEDPGASAAPAAPVIAPEVPTSLLYAGDQLGRRRAIATLDDGDLAIVQHEYGIYGGTDGDEVLEVLEGLTVPTIVVLHTVLAEPTPGQWQVLRRVIAAADAVVVFIAAAAVLLEEVYGAPPEKVTVIPHGVPARFATLPVVQRPSRNRILTWGLIGPGKGIEWGVRSLALLRDLDPAPHYTVLGQTHPKVLASHGDEYRESLLRLAEELGVGELLSLEAVYASPDELARRIALADAVLLPYDSREQVSSGVLVEAIAAGKPVVATAFPHAVEQLAAGGGVVVPHEDPSAIAAALRTVLADPAASLRRPAAAREADADATWPVVARRYRALADDLLHAVGA